MPPKVAELKLRQEEVSSLKNRLSETEAKLKEEQRVHAKLRFDSEQRQHQLNAVESLIATEQEKHRWNVEKILTSKTALEEGNQRKINLLKAQIGQIQQEISSFDLISSQNNQLVQRLKDLSFQYYKLKKRNTEDLELRKQKTFDTRMTLDEALRDTIRTLSQDFKEKAFAKMHEESANAARENVKLYAEYDLREQQCEELIDQQKISYENLMKVRIAREVVAATTEMHEQSSVLLFKRQEELVRRIELISLVTVSLEREIVELTEKVNHKKSLLTQLETLGQETADIRLKRRRCTKHVVQKAEQIMALALDFAAKARFHQSQQLASSMLSACSEPNSPLTRGDDDYYEVGEDDDDGNAVSTRDEVDDDSANDDIFTQLAKQPTTAQAPGGVQSLLDMLERGTPGKRDSDARVPSATATSPPALTSRRPEANPNYAEIRMRSAAAKATAESRLGSKENPAAALSVHQRVAGFDTSHVWSSSTGDCNIMSGALRKLLRQQRR